MCEVFSFNKEPVILTFGITMKGRGACEQDHDCISKK